MMSQGPPPGAAGQPNPASGPPAGAAAARPPPPRPEDAGRQILVKSRDLVPVLRDKWGVAIREGAQSLVLSSSEKGDTHQQNRFETSVEDFHSTLDQMELNLKCAHETTTQSQSSSRYMLGNLSYHQYIATAKQQVAFTNQIKDMLKVAAQDIVDHSVQQN